MGGSTMQPDKEPTCVLCSGRLVEETQVTIQAGGSGVLCYTMAWVCTNCSAAFPIAIGSGGVIRKPRPLYEGGKRTV